MGSHPGRARPRDSWRRNVNYDGYQRQVENEYYFEDGGRIVGGQYYPKASDQGEKIDIPDGPVTPGGQ